MNFIRLSHNGFTLEVDCDISTCNTASLHQAVKSIVYVSPFVAHWCISILIIIPIQNIQEINEDLWGNTI